MNEHIEFLSDTMYRLYKDGKITVHELYEYLKQLDDMADELIHDTEEEEE